MTGNQKLAGLFFFSIILLQYYLYLFQYVYVVFSSHHITTPSSDSESLPSKFSSCFYVLYFFMAHCISSAFPAWAWVEVTYLSKGILPVASTLRKTITSLPEPPYWFRQWISSLLPSWVWSFYFVHMLDNIYWYFLNKCYFTGVRGSLNAALICISLMDTGTEHFFFYSAIWVVCLENQILISLACELCIGWIVWFLIVLRLCLYSS